MCDHFFTPIYLFLNRIEISQPIGATLDFFGFFWAELISGVVLIALIINYYSDARPSPPVASASVGLGK